MTALAAYDTAASTHSGIPVREDCPVVVSAEETPTMMVPRREIVIPAAPGHAARGGQPSRRPAHTKPSTTVPISSRPSARAPGAKYCPAPRIATKDDAHKHHRYPGRGEGRPARDCRGGPGGSSSQRSYD
jgi:hypothetical protein